MAQRRGSRTRTVGVDLSKLTHESRAFLLEVGMEAVAKVAEKIAEEANRLAPALEDGYETLEDKTSERTHSTTIPKRRGPNKRGASDSGPIKESIFSQESHKVPNSYLVIAPAWYAHFVEYGTSEHIMPRISSKKGNTMIFPGTNNFKGQLVKTKKVDHPGAKKRPFLRPAADKADEFVSQVARELGLSVTKS